MYLSSTSFSILLTFPQTPVFVLKLPLSSELQYHVTPRIYSTSFFSFRLHFYPCILPCSRHYPHFPPPFPCQYPHFTPYSLSLSSHVTPPPFCYYQHFFLFLFDTSFFPLRGPFFHLFFLFIFVIVPPFINSTVLVPSTSFIRLPHYSLFCPPTIFLLFVLSVSILIFLLLMNVEA
jgi:hypothetical protein